ncbi:MAG: TIR domain-containing protein [Ruminococcaceae bacterium]|nr:TIR domain-containing protein [Oscillospiraceae bacterium]
MPEHNENNIIYDAAISYHHDTGFYMAHIIFSSLALNGYKVFMDKNMNSGEYEDKIKNAISKCKNFIVILFPDDLEECKNENSWLSRESAWAVEYGVPNIIPIMCDGFKWPKTDEDLSESMKVVMRNNGLPIHKDKSLDKDLDDLCDNYIKNVNQSKSGITTDQFFNYNLNGRIGFTINGVDMAFHAGNPWLEPGRRKKLLTNSLEKNIPFRVLINTVDAAESIAQYMRDETGSYKKFSEVREIWKKLASLYPNVLEVRECNIPLIHVYHHVKFTDDTTGKQSGEAHIRYYAYNNTIPENVFEHKISSSSNHYSVYTDEFEFLWKKSTKL